MKPSCEMKMFKNIVMALCLLNLCAQGVGVTYRHFHPAAQTDIAR